MSAFIVSKRHIDTLLTAAIVGTRDGARAGHMNYFFWGDGPPTYVNENTASDVGQRLWLENYMSVVNRYGTSVDIPGPAGFRQTDIGRYEFVALPFDQRPSAVQVLKAIRCYEYQSCEHPDWETSEAKAFCDMLTRTLITALPGYADAPWEW